MTQRSYTDDKGRTRWHRNDEVAAIVKQLGEYLIIGGYPEEHAARYGPLSYAIARWPESVDTLDKRGDLSVIPGVGGIIVGYLEQIIRTGTTDKFNDDQYGMPPPLSVLELTAIPGLGAKTAKRLYEAHQIVSLSVLCERLAQGSLTDIKGIGPKMRDTIQSVCAESSA